MTPPAGRNGRSVDLAVGGGCGAAGEAATARRSCSGTIVPQRQASRGGQGEAPGGTGSSVRKSAECELSSHIALIDADKINVNIKSEPKIRLKKRRRRGRPGLAPLRRARPKTTSNEPVGAGRSHTPPNCEEADPGRLDLLDDVRHSKCAPAALAAQSVRARSCGANNLSIPLEHLEQ